MTAVRRLVEPKARRVAMVSIAIWVWLVMVERARVAEPSAKHVVLEMAASTAFAVVERV